MGGCVAFGPHQVGVDRGGKARVIELERNICALLAILGGALPACAEFDGAGEHPEVGSGLVGFVLVGNDLGFGVERQGADCAGEAVFGLSECADLSRPLPTSRAPSLLPFRTHHARARRAHWHVHFTPTSASWINQVERWFAELTRKQLQRGVHTSTRQLEASAPSSKSTTKTPSPSGGPNPPTTSSPPSNASVSVSIKTYATNFRFR